MSKIKKHSPPQKGTKRTLMPQKMLWQPRPYGKKQ